MNRAQDFMDTIEDVFYIASQSHGKRTHIVESASAQALAAGNAVIKKVKGWGGFTIGVEPLAREMRLPPHFVQQVLSHLAKYKALIEQSSDVYRIDKRMQFVQGFDRRGKLEFDPSFHTYDPMLEPRVMGISKLGVR
jgi:hypothetical protein